MSVETMPRLAAVIEWHTGEDPREVEVYAWSTVEPCALCAAVTETAVIVDESAFGHQDPTRTCVDCGAF